jgi:hypothetical protein
MRRLKDLRAASIGFRNALKDYSDTDRNIDLAIFHPIRDLAKFSPGIRSKINIQLNCRTPASIPQSPRMRKDSPPTTRSTLSHVEYLLIRIKPRPMIAFGVARTRSHDHAARKCAGQPRAHPHEYLPPIWVSSNFPAQLSSTPTGESAPCLSCIRAESNNGAISW